MKQPYSVLESLLMTLRLITEARWLTSHARFREALARTKQEPTLNVKHGFQTGPRRLFR